MKLQNIFYFIPLQKFMFFNRICLLFSFYEIDNNELKSLDYEILDQILRNDHLKLKNEDLLVELLIEKTHN